MDTPANGTQDMLAIMEKLSSLQGENGFNPVAQQVVEDMEPLAMPPPNYNAASTATNAAIKPMGYNKLLGKPKRPLSAYNIFFQHEREKIVTNAPDTPVTLESLKIDSTRKLKKRRHRKSHGKIGFADLARKIAEKWKTLDKESRSVFEACALKEKARYQKEISEWKAYKKTEAAEEEAAVKNQISMNHAELLYSSSRSMMQDGMNNRNMSNMHSMESSGWSSNAMTDGTGMHNGQMSYQASQPSSTGNVQDPRDYLKITQQVIDMARASLSLPLFANLGRTGILDDSTARTLLQVGEQQQRPSLHMNGGNQSSSLLGSNNLDSTSSLLGSNNLDSASSLLRSNNLDSASSLLRSNNLDSASNLLRSNNLESSSSLLRSNNLESGQLSSGALLNVPYGSSNMSSLDSDTLYQNQLMQSLDSNIQGYLNQTQTSQQIRDELETRAFLNQPMQYHQAELDSNTQDYSDFGQSAQEQGLSALRNQARQADGTDELVNMINASLKDHF